MIPVVSIVGRSDTGKTTLIEKLVRELTSRGYRIGTIKHDVHGFDIDREGKDSYRHRAAGSRITVISSPAKAAVITDTDRDMDIDEIVFKYMDGVDLIITEGYKGNSKPKIEVYRKEAYPDLLCTADDNLLALATDIIHDLGVPQYDINDAGGLATLIEQKFLREGEKGGIALEIDGEMVPLKPFISSMLTRAIYGMISSLKGCGSPGKIRIRIDRE